MPGVITVTPNPCEVGATVTVTGSSFTGKAQTRLYLDGALKATFRSTVDGKFGPMGLLVGTAPKTQLLEIQQRLLIDGKWTWVPRREASVSINVGTTTTPKPEPTPTPGPVPNQPSGFLMPASSPAGFRRVFSDDFNIPIPEGRFPADTGGRWGAYRLGWRDTREQAKGDGGIYDPAVISVHDGMLDIHCRTFDGQHRVSTPYPIAMGAPGVVNGREFLYGQWSAAMRATAGDGVKVAWMLWPESEQPAGYLWHPGGELDFPEGDLDGVIKGFVHRRDGTNASDQSYVVTTERFPTWHVFTCRWRPDLVEYLLNGQVIHESRERIPNERMHINLQCETDLNYSDPLPAAIDAHIYTDWVTWDVLA